ncbi:MAG: hypothetical protein FIA93_00325, partial [Deltaproteobacteria bacterium]|nr:hypothetical protein [Deltaproteobacteria bacterium]
RRALAVVAAGILLAASPATAAAAPAAGKGLVVSAVRFQVSSPYLISYSELAGLVTIRPGSLLTEEAVRDSIRGLYSKSVFREVVAYAREEDGKADVLFYLRPSPLVSEIEVKGAGKVLPAQIQAASRIRRGISLEERDFREAEAAVKKLLHQKGFTSASVTISASCNLENGAGKIRIEVREGSPAVVRSISMPGAVHFTQDRILEVLGASPGSPFDYKRWEEGVRKLRIAYKRSGFLTVHISEANGECEKGGGFCLTARVEEGPRYEVRWEGQKAYSVSKLEGACGIYGDEETTEGALARDLRDRLLAFYREHDYLRAEVTVDVLAGEGDRRLLKIAVREGLAGYLKAIRFTGNANLSGKQLRKQMISEEKGVFSFLTGSGKFREVEWTDDLNALIGLYQKEGFVRARISSVDNVWDDRGGITATIHMEEDGRYRLREIRFLGNDHFLRGELMAIIGNREGKFVDYVGLERDQEVIAAHYRDAGYLDVRIAARLLFDEGKDTTAALFQIEEGPRYRLGKVVVQGNLLTDPVVVHREVGIPEGSPAGEKDLLKFQQSVYGTGLYKSVRVRKVKRPSEGILDLVVEVEETLFFEIEYGAGYGTDTGIRGFVGARNRNLDGKGRSFTSRVSVSQKEQKYIGDLRQPWILGNRWKWEGGLTAYFQEAERVSFSLRKASVIGSITQTFFERSTVSFQYEVSRDHVFNVAPGAILSREDQGSANIAAVRGLVVLDLRDDPFNPRHGSLNSGTTELASYYLGSEVDYLKLAGQSSWYFPVFRRSTLVASGRAGYIRPMRDTVEVPIQKRFFIGGRTTVRG